MIGVTALRAFGDELEKLSFYMEGGQIYLNPQQAAMARQQQASRVVGPGGVARTQDEHRRAVREATNRSSQRRAPRATAPTANIRRPTAATSPAKPIGTPTPAPRATATSPGTPSGIPKPGAAATQGATPRPTTSAATPNTPRPTTPTAVPNAPRATPAPKASTAARPPVPRPQPAATAPSLPGSAPNTRAPGRFSKLMKGGLGKGLVGAGIALGGGLMAKDIYNTYQDAQDRAAKRKAKLLRAQRPRVTVRRR